MFCVRKLLIALVIVGTFGLGSNATARADTISFPGNNFVTVSNTDGAYSAVNLNQPAGPTDLRQQKISLYQAVAALPDSTTMLLFGGGLAGIAAEFRRRR